MFRKSQSHNGKCSEQTNLNIKWYPSSNIIKELDEY
jgi:hypothetical protein